MPIAEAMLALVLMDHALRHRAQCGDVRVAVAPIPAQRALSAAGAAAARPTAVAPFAALSFAYFAYAGLIGTYGPLWFQSLGYSTFAIGVLTSLQSATRLFSPYAWGWLADHTGGASGSCGSPAAARCSPRSATSCPPLRLGRRRHGRCSSSAPPA